MDLKENVFWGNGGEALLCLCIYCPIAPHLLGNILKEKVIDAGHFTPPSSSVLLKYSILVMENVKLAKGGAFGAAISCPLSLE